MPTSFFVFVISVLLAAQVDAEGFSFKVFTNPTFNSNAYASHLVTLSKMRFSKTIDPVISPVSAINTRMFYTQMSIGTPPQKLNLALDTASSPIWSQSSSCSECFHVTTPNFEANNSITFLPMSSSNSLCQGMLLQPNGSMCIYQIDYAGNQVSEGIFALDTLTTAAATIPDIAFGLGIRNQIASFTDPNEEGGNPIVGVLGLARDDPTSLFVHQMRDITGQKFLYCLSLSDQGFLIAGDGAVPVLPEGPAIQTTPIFGGMGDLYYIRLLGISVNGERLPIDPDVFLFQGLPGVVIDTVAPYTAMVDPAFQIMRAAVVQYFFSGYSWVPLNQSIAGFDLCYDIASVKKRGESGEAPASLVVTFHFEDADLELDQEASFQEFEDLEEYCMTLISVKKGSLGILGAYQQTSRGFLFDVAESQLSFTSQNYC